RQDAGGVEIDHADAVRLQRRRAALGAGDGGLDAVLDPRQLVDEMGDGGTGGDADDTAVLDVADGLLRRPALLCFAIPGGGIPKGKRRKVTRYSSARTASHCVFVTGSTERRLPRRIRAKSPSRSSMALISSRPIVRLSLRLNFTSTSCQRGSSGLL